MKGLMIDCSRNAVMNVESIKKLVLTMEKLRYDTLLLYVEDTYEIEGEPLFGHLRGRYSKAELREVDAFCNAHHIELVPCIQTLAHLNAIFKWHDAYDKINDCDDILLVDDDETYKLIDRMLSTMASCVTSRKINVGMDEAFMLGFGNYRRKHGVVDRAELILRHLNKVCNIAAKYGFEPMLWADMVCYLASGSEDYYGQLTVEATKKFAANLPKNLSLIYWHYVKASSEHHSATIRRLKGFGRDIMFAGGAWSWNGFAPNNAYSIENTKPAVKACLDNGVKDIFLTLWGDDGGECSRFAMLPTIVYTAGIFENKTVEQIKKDFFDITGMNYDDFMILDEMNESMPGDVEKNTECCFANNKYTKLWLYNDPFLGMADYRVTGKENAHYKEVYDKLMRVNVTDEYKPLFAYAAALADLLSVKAELGANTRKAYNSGDKNLLREVAETQYSSAIEKLNEFYKEYRDFWFSENKPHGFDIQDVRLGGLMQRLKSCKERLIDYCDGKTERIPELEEPVVAARRYATWGGMVSPNVITHIV